MLIVIRPETGCAATVAAARAQGLPADGQPLFTVRPLDWETPPASEFDAMLIGSANALRCGGPGLGGLTSLPVHAVGEATAAAAREAGLTVVASGTGGLQMLLAALASGHRRLLRLAGRERITLEPPAGVTIAERVVYASEPLEMPAALAERLRGGGALVLLHSAGAARHFASECERLGVPRSGIALAALGARIAAAAGGGWAHCGISERPDDAALLALAAGMWQSPVRGNEERVEN
jgi:uroporphyrinogen-III synthase